MAKIRKASTDRLVKSVVGGAAGGAILQVVKGTLLKGKNPLYGDLGGIVVGALAPTLVKMDGVGELGAGMIGAGAASILASTVPSLAGFNSALGGGQQQFRQSMISNAKKKGTSSTVLR